MEKTLTPKTATTDSKIFKLKQAAIRTKDHWLMVFPEGVLLVAQKDKRKPTAKIELSKKDFNKMVKFYLTGHLR